MPVSCRTAVLATAALLVLDQPLTAHDGPHDGPTTASFRVGKDGGINFREDVRLADTLVPKGKYRFTHRIDGDVHVITLTRIAARNLVDTAVYEVSTTLMAGPAAQGIAAPGEGSGGSFSSHQRHRDRRRSGRSPSARTIRHPLTVRSGPPTTNVSNVRTKLFSEKIVTPNLPSDPPITL